MVSKGGEIMQYGQLLNEDKCKILNLIRSDFVSLDFSNLVSIVENNHNVPSWMDVYILIYKCKFPQDISTYNILLNKLSKPIFRVCFKTDDEEYISEIDEFMIRRYIRYLITGEKIKFDIESKYIPNKEYIKEILRYKKFYKCGIYIEHIKKDEFILNPIDYKIINIEEARESYENIFDAYDLYKNLELDNKNFLDNLEACIILGKDKRMVATLGNINTYIKCRYCIQDDYITIKDTSIKIFNEDNAKKFEEELYYAYQFFRNVINTEDKKDIVSEIYNKKVLQEIMEQFEDSMASYLNVIEDNKDLIDWIVTISKESKYKLKITFDKQKVFYIDGNIIVTPQEAKDYYIDYMNNKKEQTSLAIYRGNMIIRIKKIWTAIKSKFKK